GVIAQAGAPLELYDRPANMFVAGFIGSPAMNLIAGRVVRSAGGLVFDSDMGSLPISRDHAVTEGRAVTYGVRPEHLQLADEGLPAEIAVIEPTGAETQVFFRAGSSDLVAVFRERHDFRPGQMVRLQPDPTRAHLFDTTSGLRI